MRVGAPGAVVNLTQHVKHPLLYQCQLHVYTFCGICVVVVQNITHSKVLPYLSLKGAAN